MTSAAELADLEQQARARVAELVWPGVPADAVAVKHLSVATTNIVFCCSTVDRRERVCVRFFGKGTDSIVERSKEQAIMEHLGAHGLCPRLIARFPGGVVQQFVEGVVLDSHEPIARYHAAMADALARWHTTDCSTELPPPQQGCTWPRMESWLRQLAACVGEEQAAPFVQEAAALRAFIEKQRGDSEEDEVVPRLCMCHNDTSAFNVVFSQKVDDANSKEAAECRATLIDLEYADYNDPHFDLGNHVCEHCGLVMDLALWPSSECQQHFVRCYLEALCRCQGRDPRTAVTERLVAAETQRVLCWCLVSHLLWAVWGVVQFVHAGGLPVCGFDHLDYARKRCRAYVLLKHQLGLCTPVPDDALLLRSDPTHKS